MVLGDSLAHSVVRQAVVDYGAAMAKKIANKGLTPRKRAACYRHKVRQLMELEPACIHKVGKQDGKDKGSAFQAVVVAGGETGFGILLMTVVAKNPWDTDIHTMIAMPCHAMARIIQTFSQDVNEVARMVLPQLSVLATTAKGMAHGVYAMVTEIGVLIYRLDDEGLEAITAISFASMTPVKAERLQQHVGGTIPWRDTTI